MGTKLKFFFFADYSFTTTIRKDFPQQKNPGKSHRQFHQQNKRQNGFILIGLVALTPLFLAALTAIALTLVLTHQIESDRKTCRQGLAEGLENGAPFIQKLMALNPQAQALRIQVIITKAKLATALATKNLTAIALYTRQLQILKKTQKLLHQNQLILLQTGNQVLRTAQLNTWRRLQLKKTSIHSRAANPPLLKSFAVHPDDPDMAPTWSLDKNFSLAQKVKQTWLLTYQLKGPLSHFMQTAGRMEDSCEITLSHKWRAQIAEGKF